MDLMQEELVNSEDVIGIKVINQQGENLGKIESLMLLKKEGKVAYVVLSYGGFLGLGDKLCALPWEIFSYDTAQECFIIPVDKEKLKNDPAIFDKDHRPDMASISWRTSINKYYGVPTDRLH